MQNLMRNSKIKPDSTEKLSVTLYFQISGAAGVSWLLLQSNHDVSTFSFKLTFKTKFQKKKRNTSEKIQRSWKEKDPISWRVLATKEEYKASKKFLKNGLLLSIWESNTTDSDKLQNTLNKPKTDYIFETILPSTLIFSS